MSYYMRRRRSSTDELNLDSLVDVVTNTNGMLIYPGCDHSNPSGCGCKPDRQGCKLEAKANPGIPKVEYQKRL